MPQNDVRMRTSPHYAFSNFFCFVHASTVWGVYGVSTHYLFTQLHSVLVPCIDNTHICNPLSFSFSKSKEVSFFEMTRRENKKRLDRPCDPELIRHVILKI